MRPRMSGLAGGGSSPISIAPASSAWAASSRAGSSPRSSTMGWPVTTCSPGLARQMTPAAAVEDFRPGKPFYHEASRSYFAMIER